MPDNFNIKNNIVAFTLKDIFRILFRKKWVFFGTFLVIIIIGLLYTFVKVPQFESTARLKLLNVYYNDDFMKYFPEEAAAVGVYSTNLKGEELEITILNSFIKEIKSDEVLDKAAKAIGSNISNEDIRSSLTILTDNNKRQLLIKVLFSNPATAQKINEEIISAFIKERNIRAVSAMDYSIRNMDAEMIRLKNETESSSGKGSADEDTKIYDDLSAIKYNLAGNRDFILNSIEIFQEPTLAKKAVNSNYPREIPVIFLVAILAGLMAVFLPSIFLPLKSKDE